MILRALFDLYERLAADPGSGLPKPGYSLQSITFCIVLTPNGDLVEIADARVEQEVLLKSRKRKRLRCPAIIEVPGQGKPPGTGLHPCFLWDNAGYLLGCKSDDSDPGRTLSAHAAFRRHHLQLEPELACTEFSAVCRFLESWDPAQAGDPKLLKELLQGFGVFRISGETHCVHQSPVIAQWWSARSACTESEPSGFCLVTGKRGRIARLHEPKIRGFEPTGSLLVSFNERAYESFGKCGAEAGQGRNAPVGAQAAFGYCNALNFLLADRSRQISAGATTIVCWTEAPSPAEKVLPELIAGGSGMAAGAAAASVQQMLEEMERDTPGDLSVRCFFLGLSPNASRLSVRFWISGRLGEIFRNLHSHFDQIRITGPWEDFSATESQQHAPSPFQLLQQTARDAESISPVLAGALFRALLTGEHYPDSLVTAVLNRMRAVEFNHDEGATGRALYFKAGILKAWLIRNHQQVITPMLDEANLNKGYLLGRLFAVLERTQRDAVPGITHTIRERFFGAACSRPRETMLRLFFHYPHHLAKLDPITRASREKQVQEILKTVSEIPMRLNLINQAQFAVGYYHQRKANYKKRTGENPDTPMAGVRESAA